MVLETMPKDCHRNLHWASCVTELVLHSVRRGCIESFLSAMTCGTLIIMADTRSILLVGHSVRSQVFWVFVGDECLQAVVAAGESGHERSDGAFFKRRHGVGVIFMYLHRGYSL
jgi:hypothetical protein